MAKKPDQRDLNSDLAFASDMLGKRQLAAAKGRLLQTLRSHPDSIDALELMGAVLFEQGHADDAIELLERAVSLAPKNVSSLANLGIALTRSGNPERGLATLSAAVEIEPSNAALHVALGNAFALLGRKDEAIVSYQAGVKLDGRNPGAFTNLAGLLMSSGRRTEALKAYDAALKLQPGALDAIWGRLACQLKACDWTDFDQRLSRVLQIAEKGPLLSTPAFTIKLVSDDATTQLRLAERATANAARGVQAADRRRVRRDVPKRLRIVYVGADFRDHATANLTSGLFEAHDRSKFEVIALSFGGRRADTSDERIENACEHFEDAHNLDEAEIAARLQALNADIAIDLMGHTKNAKPGIFLRRPAPVQVNYLGFPGTSGSAAMDYLVADAFIAAEGLRSAASEKLVLMPDCYQPNDDKKTISGTLWQRDDAGLPGNSFVFASFNQAQKITPQVFAVWMRILQQCDGSVLWLLDEGEDVRSNLRAQAVRLGIEPSRLVFAPRLERADHLARIALTDLCLDTFPYTSHTTGSDALWAGVPVLTCVGQSFAARVCGSLLTVVGVPELLTSDFDAYQEKAVRLAHHRDELQGLRSRIAASRMTSPLFDTTRYARHLELAFEEMVKINRAGIEPRDIDVRQLTQ